MDDTEKLTFSAVAGHHGRCAEEMLYPTHPTRGGLPGAVLY
jgi:hypothetical protein